MFRTCAALICLAVLGLLAGCGGGSEGTGGATDVRVKGTVIATDGSPIASALVAAEGTMDKVTTGAGGGFELDTQFFGTELVLNIQALGVSSQVVIADIPSTTARIVVTLAFDRQSGSTAARDVSFTPRPDSGGPADGSENPDQPQDAGDSGSDSPGGKPTDSADKPDNSDKPDSQKPGDRKPDRKPDSQKPDQQGPDQGEPDASKPDSGGDQPLDSQPDQGAGDRDQN